MTLNKQRQRILTIFSWRFISCRVAMYFTIYSMFNHSFSSVLACIRFIFSIEYLPERERERVGEKERKREREIGRVGTRGPRSDGIKRDSNGTDTFFIVASRYGRLIAASEVATFSSVELTPCIRNCFV